MYLIGQQQSIPALRLSIGYQQVRTCATPAPGGERKGQEVRQGLPMTLCRKALTGNVLQSEKLALDATLRTPKAP